VAASCALAATSVAVAAFLGSARAAAPASDRLPIVLLDLNYTLVAERSPDASQAAETYRRWLVPLLRDRYVILITARPHAQRESTLARIREQLGWVPDEAWFNERDLPPPACKRDILERHVLPKHGRPDTRSYVALESNPRTAAMYAKLGIPGLRVWDGAQLR
jgi:hypothetical protein